MKTEQSRPSTLELAFITHRGMIRSRNEDAIAVGDQIFLGDMDAPATSRIEGSEGLVMVADGMGGHARGELASKSALKILLSRGFPCNDLVSWSDALQGANDGLYDLMAERPDVRGLGTTIVGVAFLPSSLIVFNVGDSRAYRFGNGRITRLTQDDVPMGTITPNARRTGHQITQSLGGRLARTKILPHIQAAPPLQAGECILLCSDGLTDMVSDTDLARVLGNGAGVATRACMLFDMAIQSGGKDNISVIVVAA